MTSWCVLTCGLWSTNAGTAEPTKAELGGHRTRVRIGQGSLLVRCLSHLGIQSCQAIHLLAQPGRLVRQCRRRFLAVGTVELVEIARHALLDLGQAPLHLAPREVPVSVIDRLELAAVDRHAGLAPQPEPAAAPAQDRKSDVP